MNFNIVGVIILEANVDLLETLSEDELQEVNHVVTLLDCDCTKENSINDFDIEQTNLHHKQVTETELDHLTSKNSTQSTTYQTKWAVVVIKDE